MLDTENLKVLAALVELLKALNFLFSGVDLLFEELELILHFFLALLSLLELHAEAIASVICLRELICPFPGLLRSSSGRPSFHARSIS